MTLASLTAFIAASVLLAVTPGPGVAYIVTRTLAQGRAAGLASVAGVAAGNFGCAVATGLGLTALLEASRTAYLVLTWAGAVYLVVLGARLLRGALKRVEGAAVSGRPPRQSLLRLWREGFLVALLNPKTALFYAAFLPPFIDASHPAAPQALALGAGFVAIAAVSDAAYALAAGRLAGWAAGRRGRRPVARWGRAAAGCSLIALGVAGGWAGQRRVA